MKLEPRRIAGFLRDPGSTRCVLFYGDDVGLIRERANQIAAVVVPDRDDPFRVAWLDRADATRLPEETAAMALTGGRRVVRVREGTDALLPMLKQALDGAGEALIVIEAPELTARGKLRAWADKAADVAAIGCYPDEGRSLDGILRGLLAEHGVRADPDALAYLNRSLGADRAMTASEISKLALYVGPNGVVDLDAARDCVGDAASLSIDDALHAATAGDAAGCDRALGLALAEGAAPVALLRAAQAHLLRLHQARLRMDTGQTAAAAAKSLRPPPFFRRVDAFVRALGLWSAPGLLRAVQAMVVAERGCKRTGAPDGPICRDAIAMLARHAGAVARRDGSRR